MSEFFQGIPYAILLLVLGFLLLVKGAVPGPKKALVTIKETVKANA